MLKLTKKADYGLIAVRHLASHPTGGSRSAKEIAEAHGIPHELMAKILQRLVKQGVLNSHHGTNGGYSLARPASQITAFEIIRAIDGPLFITSCVTKRGECYQTPRCTVREPLRKVNESIVKALSEVTISAMGDDHQDLVQMEGVTS